MAKSEGPRIAVIGAGPIGVEAALYGRSLQLPVTLYERTNVGAYVRHWGHVRMFSPFAMNTSPLGRATLRAEQPNHEFPADNAYLTGREHMAAYVDPLARTRIIKECLRTDVQVLGISRAGTLKEDDPGEAKRARQPFRLLVRESKTREQIEPAEVVLDCSGTYGQHRWLGDGGIPAIGERAAEAHMAYGLEDVLGERRSVYAGKSIVVVGAGYSAATTVCNLAALAEQHGDTWVIWLVRGTGTQPLPRLTNDPLRERDRLAVRANTLATRGEGNIEFHNQSVVEAVEFLGPDKGFRVTARCAGQSRTWDVDRVVGNVGYTPDTALYRELQVHESSVTLGPMNLALALRKQAGSAGVNLASPPGTALRNPEPNFFILGAKSYGRNSDFLVKNGLDQIREVFALITEKGDMDLYKKR
jgi:thioredoxin reductase